MACLVRQSLSGQAPLYLADDSRLVSDSTRRSLRSADVSTCVVPRTLSSYGDRTFAAAGPRLWNSLPVQLRNPDITYGLFRRQLEGHLFSGSRTWRSVTSDMRRHRITLTYLLTGWLSSRVVSVLDWGAEGPGFKSQSRRYRVTVLGKLFTSIVPLFTKQRNW